MHEQTHLITIDGPGGSGKGTLSRRLAADLGWHFLDSGSLYRLTAIAAIAQDVALTDAQQLAYIGASLPVKYETSAAGEPKVLLNDEDVTTKLKLEQIGNAASKVAALPSVRQALLQRQRDFYQQPGLVADGRDMGTVVFPQAPLKIYLDATAMARARRRQKQLSGLGIYASLDNLLAEINERDLRDKSRAAAPLKAAADAVVIDTTELDIDAVYQLVLAEAQRVFGSAIVAK